MHKEKLTNVNPPRITTEPTFSPSLDNQHENFSESIFVIYISITFKQRKDKYENYY